MSNELMPHLYTRMETYSRQIKLELLFHVNFLRLDLLFHTNDIT